MSAELLRQAADRLDRNAAPLKGESWDYDKFEDGTPWVVHLDVDFDGDDVPTVATTGMGCSGLDHAAWIALLGPQIASSLVAWLRAEADCLDEVARISGRPTPAEYGNEAPAALARAIVGKQT